MNYSSINFLASLDLSPDQVFGKGNLLVIHEKTDSSSKHGGGGGGESIDASFLLQLLMGEFHLYKNNNQQQQAQRRSEFGSSTVARKVLLILNHQTEKHWSMRCSKLGINLETMKNSNNLIIIDSLRDEFDKMMQGLDQSPTSTIDDQSTRAAAVEGESRQNQRDEITKLLGQCKSSIDSLHIPGGASSSNRPKLLIIIENLTTLFYRSNSSSYSSSSITKSILEFLRVLRTYRHSELDTCLAVLVNSNSSGSNSNSSGTGGDERVIQSDANYMTNLITQALQNLTFELCPLQTGYSDEINGKLRVSLSRKSYHYKIEDRAVKFVAIL